MVRIRVSEEELYEIVVSMRGMLKWVESLGEEKRLERVKKLAENLEKRWVRAHMDEWTKVYIDG